MAEQWLMTEIKNDPVYNTFPYCMCGNMTGDVYKMLLGLNLPSSIRKFYTRTSNSI